jgi:hypothetical protein
MDASLAQLTERERSILLRAATAVFEEAGWIRDWEFPIRIGMRREEMRGALLRWPEVWGDHLGLIYHCLNEMCNGLHISDEDWKARFDFTREEAFAVRRRMDLSRNVYRCPCFVLRRGTEREDTIGVFAAYGWWDLPDPAAATYWVGAAAFVRGPDQRRFVREGVPRAGMGIDELYAELPGLLERCWSAIESWATPTWSADDPDGAAGGWRPCDALPPHRRGVRGGE